MKIDSDDAAKPRATAGFLVWVTRSVCHALEIRSDGFLREELQRSILERP